MGNHQYIVHYTFSHSLAYYLCGWLLDYVFIADISTAEIAELPIRWEDTRKWWVDKYFNSKPVPSEYETWWCQLHLDFSFVRVRSRKNSN
jgi:hypothetical protein